MSYHGHRHSQEKHSCINLCTKRGAVVEWLERLAVVWKIAGSSHALAKRLENSHCPRSSKWVPG